MTFGELKQRKDIPDDAIIVVSSSDHTYKPAYIDNTTAMKYGQSLTEDCVDFPVEVGGSRIPVVLVL